MDLTPKHNEDPDFISDAGRFYGSLYPHLLDFPAITGSLMSLLTSCGLLFCIPMPGAPETSGFAEIRTLLVGFRRPP